jgi:hypothetical protein
LTKATEPTCFFQEFRLNAFKQIQHFRITYDNPYEEALNIGKHFASFSTLVSLSIDANCGESGCTNELATIIFHQSCRSLQRLYLDGNVFEQESSTRNNTYTFHFPSLVYLRVSRLHINLALQLLEQCPQLRSFATKVYGEPRRDNTSAVGIYVPARIKMGLMPMKHLSLEAELDFGNDFGSRFLQLLLACCPNLRSLHFDVHCRDDWERLLEVDWWPQVLISGYKLKKISLRLEWSTRGIGHNWFEKYKRFQTSPFFAQFGAEIRYEFSSEFMRRLTYDMYIKN